MAGDVRRSVFLSARRVMTVEPAGENQMTAPVKVWDLPTRLIHWCLVLLVAFSWWTGENEFGDLHILSGYAVLTLVLVRLY
ncbi:MAG: hypothetical protein RLN70_05960, partial [Rhodospirillaceae bacterium]